MSKLQTKLLSYDELQDPGSKGLVIETKDSQLNLFVVKKDDQIFVYENSCPHTSGPLDWMPDSFLDEDNNYIMCANHGALFQINDGHERKRICHYPLILIYKGQCTKEIISQVLWIVD